MRQDVAQGVGAAETDAVAFGDLVQIFAKPRIRPQATRIDDGCTYAFFSTSLTDTGDGAGRSGVGSKPITRGQVATQCVYHTPTRGLVRTISNSKVTMSNRKG